MPKKLLFNFNREVIQNYTYVKYVGTIITATNTLEKPIKSAILTGSTKHRDIDTGEFLETFEEGRNLELVSVKTPVLTTAGKNLFDEKLENNRDIDGNTGVVLNGGRTIPINFISVEPNTSYTLTRPVATKNVGIRYYSKSQDYLSLQTFPGYTGKFSATFSTPSDCYFIKFIDEANTLEKGYQIEQGSTATSYEPYKSNILSTPSDLELRGIGDVKDELNCLTGEVVERVGEIVLNGSENWTLTYNTNDVRYNIYSMVLSDVDTTINNSFLNCLSDKAKTDKWSNINVNFTDKTFGLLSNRQLRVQFNGTLEELRMWLSETQPTIQYLKQKSIKTVDLSMLDQNENKVSSISSFNDTTHIMASSETIPPIFEGYLATKEG